MVKQHTLNIEILWESIMISQNFVLWDDYRNQFPRFPLHPAFLAIPAIPLLKPIHVLMDKTLVCIISLNRSYHKRPFIQVCRPASWEDVWLPGSNYNPPYYFYLLSVKFSSAVLLLYTFFGCLKNDSCLGKFLVIFHHI